MALEEAAAWLDGDLVLPIGGKKYRVPEFDAELGMRVEVILNASRGNPTDRQRQILTDEEERETYRDVLGPAYDQMVKDGVTWPRLRHAAFTAMFHFNISPEMAEQHWNRAPAEGKAPAASRPATRRTTAAASSTRSPASGSGTRSRRRS